MVHIGIIPDGNRRWCKDKNIDYKLENLEELWFSILLEQIKDLSLGEYQYLEIIDSLTFYVCSIENINRNDNTSKFIYLFLEKLFYFYKNYETIIDELYINETENKKMMILNFLKTLFNSLNIVPIGELHVLPENIYNGLIELKSNNKESNKYNLFLGIAYDFKEDLINYGLNKNKNYNRKQSEIDIVIRTGGELRLSGFFPSHVNYAEFFYYKKFWPEIKVKDINQVVSDFKNKRERRFGK